MRAALLGLTAAGCLLAGAAPAAAQRQVFLGELRKEAPDLAAELDRLRGAEGRERAAGLHALLRRVGGAPELAGLLVPAEGDAPVGRLHRGLWAELLRRAQALEGEARSELATLQQEAAELALRSERPPSPELLAARYPASEAGRAAARLLLDRAVEAGDRPGARLLAARLASSPAERPRLLERPADGAQQAAPPRGERLVVAQSARFEAAPEQAGDGQQEPPSPAVPLRIGERVCLANGSELRVFDLEGRLVGVTPQDPRAASAPRPTLRESAIAVWGEVAFVPLVLERWLAPARADRRGGGSFAGRFHSLLGFDPASGRLLWWDGDPGPMRTALGAAEPGPPPGFARTPAEQRQALRRAHVLACAADAARVYAAVTFPDREPTLQVIAFRRAPGAHQRLVLEPAWGRPTFVLAAERPGQRSGEDRPVAPEVAASLALDGAGRLLCTTDLGVTACLDAAQGTLLWAHQAPPAQGERTRRPVLPRRFRRSARAAPPSRVRPEPARFFAGEGEPAALLLAGGSLLAVRPRDGAALWSLPCPGADRVAVGPDWALAYGGRRAVLVGRDGARRADRAVPRVVGAAAQHGATLHLPAQDGAGYQVLRIEVRPTALRPAGAWPVPVRDPFNLGPIPGGVVAASRRHILFLRWEPKAGAGSQGR